MTRLLKFPERKDSGTWKSGPTPPGHNRSFVCHGCGAQVRRPWPSRPFDDKTLPGRPFDDDFKCLNCWYGKPNQEETTTHEKQPHRMPEEETDDLSRRLEYHAEAEAYQAELRAEMKADRDKAAWEETERLCNVIKFPLGLRDAEGSK